MNEMACSFKVAFFSWGGWDNTSISEARIKVIQKGVKNKARVGKRWKIKGKSINKYEDNKKIETKEHSKEQEEQVKVQKEHSEEQEVHFKIPRRTF